ncbi:winged helix-turn-helix domain-containing protein [Noviherbaspirillum saxi]|uniref:Winged helix-turn helix domain-containing protein n=1 Tax=Noviherbaspirillum saxi TaxID=2320863 RepID=A0A3A3FFV3_9BURK|nr:hypothetical protein D3871_26820 [Noviherbaspirillum saxi]
MLKALRFSCQRPTRRASQRDEKAILEWKRKRWPMLKKARREWRTIPLKQQWVRNIPQSAMHLTSK